MERSFRHGQSTHRSMASRRTSTSPRSLRHQRSPDGSRLAAGSWRGTEEVTDSSADTRTKWPRLGGELILGGELRDLRGADLRCQSRKRGDPGGGPGQPAEGGMN